MEIAVRQFSGLGNQIFQYAAGLYYAAKYKAALRILIDPADDPASYGSPRPFQLTSFEIDAPMRKPNSIEQLICTRNAKLRPAAKIARSLANARLWQEPELHRFYPDLPFHPLPSTVYLRAYWQAAGYAEAIENQLRAQLRFSVKPGDQDAAVLEAIASSRCPVSVHLRRGDYLLAKQRLVLPLSYYRSGWQQVLQEFDDVTFFIFSDDIEYARERLPGNAPRHFVAHNDTGTAYQDLRLMAACRHHMIANSSFSWWGAWLNSSPDKRVFAPKYWRNTLESYHPDLFPQGWQCIENLDND